MQVAKADEAQDKLNTVNALLDGLGPEFIQA